MKISVIIPVYNVEQYLHECVNSVLGQSYQDLEIILVDDGSFDHSPQICDEYQKIDKRILVIHKENGGLSDARNVGILHATGEYVLFLDSDDFWDDFDAVQKLVACVSTTKTDVLNYSYSKFAEGNQEKIPYINFGQIMPNGLSQKEQLDFLTLNGLYIASACNKMVRRSLLTEDMMFVKGIYSEDIDWCARLLLKAGSFDFINESFYCYRQREGSIRHTISDKKCNDLTSNILKCMEYAEGADESVKAALLRYTAFQFGTFFMVHAHADNFQEECIRKLSSYAWILKYHQNNRKLQILHVGCRLIGYKNMCRLTRMFFGRR